MQSAPLPNTWLVQFKIERTSASDYLYANTRQQVEISLVVQARENMALSDTEFESLCIVELDDNGSYAPVPPSQRGDWWYSAQRNEYDYYSAAIQHADSPDGNQTSTRELLHTVKGWLEAVGTSLRMGAPQAEPVRRKRLYMMTAAPGGTTKKLFARITRDTGDIYVTDNIFVSDVTLVAVQVPRYSAALDYLMDRILVSGSEASGIFLYELHLQHRLARFHCAGMNPMGMIQWDDRDPAQTHASNVGHAGPGEASVKYNKSIVLGSAFQRAELISNISPGKLTLVLQGDINIPYHSPSALTHNGPCTINAIDFNGNEHALRVAFMGESGFEERTTLVLLDG
jgi:hypothetical protein